MASLKQRLYGIPDPVEEVTYYETEEVEQTNENIEEQESIAHYRNVLTTYIEKRGSIIQQHSQAIKKLTQYEDSLAKKTILSWRQGLQSAKMIDYPNRWELLDLYVELRYDPFLDSLISFQKNKLKSISRRVKNADGSLNDNYTKLFNDAWMDQLISGFVESQLNGFHIFEIDEIIEMRGIYTINRLNDVPDKNVIPEFQELKKLQYSTKGDYNYKNNKWVIELIYDNNRNLGILSRLAPYLLYKTLSMKSWAVFIEKYGLPGIIMKTPIVDKAKKNELSEQIKSIASEFSAILEKEDDLQLLEPSNVDAYKTFKEMIELVDRTAANEIIGGSLLFTGTQEGGSYALSKSHEDVSDMRTKSDLKEIERYVNSFLLSKLKKLGVIKPDADIYFEFNYEEYISQTTRAAMIAQLAPFASFNWDKVEKEMKIGLNGDNSGIDSASE